MLGKSFLLIGCFLILLLILRSLHLLLLQFPNRLSHLHSISAMLFSKTAIVLAILPFAFASTCDKSSALPYSSSSETPSNDSSGSNQAAIDAAMNACISGCGSDASCLVGCLDDACTSHCGSSSSSCHSSCLSDPCSAFYGSGSDSPNADQLQICYKAAEEGQSNSAGRKMMLKERATFTCSSSQTCYTETNGNLFCLNTATGASTSRNSI